MKFGLYFLTIAIHGVVLFTSATSYAQSSFQQEMSQVGENYHTDLWKLEKDRDGIKVYSRPVDKSGLLGFKIEGILQAPIELLMAAVRKVEDSHLWMPGLNTKYTIQEISDTEAVTYAVNDMPWPCDDRDYITHNQLYLDENRQLLYVLSKSIEHADYLRPPRDITRAVVHYSNMGMRPIDAQTTYLEWTIFADPKGDIPTFVVNFYQKSFPFEFFKNLEKHAKQFPQPLRPGLAMELNRLRRIIQKSALKAVPAGARVPASNPPSNAP